MSNKKIFFWVIYFLAFASPVFGQNIFALYDSVSVSWKKAKYQKGIIFLEKILPIAEKMHQNNPEDTLFSIALNDFGVFHYFSGNYLKAENFYEKSKSIAEKDSMQKQIFRAKLNLANVFLKLHKFDEAEKLLSQLENDSLDSFHKANFYDVFTHLYEKVDFQTEEFSTLTKAIQHRKISKIDSIQLLKNEVDLLEINAKNGFSEEYLAKWDSLFPLLQSYPELLLDAELSLAKSLYISEKYDDVFHLLEEISPEFQKHFLPESDLLFQFHVLKASNLIQIQKEKQALENFEKFHNELQKKYTLNHYKIIQSKILLARLNASQKFFQNTLQLLNEASQAHLFNTTTLYNSFSDFEKQAYYKNLMRDIRDILEVLKSSKFSAIQSFVIIEKLKYLERSSMFSQFSNSNFVKYSFFMNKSELSNFLINTDSLDKKISKTNFTNYAITKPKVENSASVVWLEFPQIKTENDWLKPSFKSVLCMRANGKIIIRFLSENSEIANYKNQIQMSRQIFWQVDNLAQVNAVSKYFGSDPQKVQFVYQAKIEKKKVKKRKKKAQFALFSTGKVSSFNLKNQSEKLSSIFHEKLVKNYKNFEDLHYYVEFVLKQNKGKYELFFDQNCNPNQINSESHFSIFHFSQPLFSTTLDFVFPKYQSGLIFNFSFSKVLNLSDLRINQNSQNDGIVFENVNFLSETPLVSIFEFAKKNQVKNLVLIPQNLNSSLKKNFLFEFYHNYLRYKNFVKAYKAAQKKLRLKTIFLVRLE